MKLAVFGSTGGTGRHILAQALEQGHDVTALVRSPEKLNQTHEKLHIVQGDVLDLDSVEGVIQGKDAVLCTIGLPKIMDNTMIRANGTKNIIHVMDKTGVRRFICQSSLGVGNSRNILPFFQKYFFISLLLRRVMADHEAQEKYIKQSRLEWIIARPGSLTDGEGTGSYRHGISSKDQTLTFKISRADTADFMLKQLADDAYLHQTPCLSY